MTFFNPEEEGPLSPGVKRGGGLLEDDSWGGGEGSPARAPALRRSISNIFSSPAELETLGVDVGEPVTKLPTFESECVKHCISV